MAANEQTFVAFVVRGYHGGTRQALRSLMGFIADWGAVVADAHRQVVPPPYLFMHSTGVPSRVGKNHHTLR
jgi:hypothetical protein